MTQEVMALRLITVLLALLLLLSFPISCKKDTEQAPLLQIYALDVGQGDSLLLRSKGTNILIDAGPEQYQELLCLRLEQLGVEKIDLAIFTHPDEDHIGGADGVLEKFAVSEVWINGAQSKEACYEVLMGAISKSKTKLLSVKDGDARQIHELLSFYVFAPLDGEAEGGNEDSIVLRMQCGQISAIFTGDAGVETEQALLARYGKAHLDCDIYKVGHHGSNTSSSQAFVEALSPQYALICCGRGNAFGHPHGEVLATLNSINTQILRTDLLGEILIESDGERIWQK